MLGAAALGAVALLELAVAYLSGSAGILADALHNLGDGVTTLILLGAFYLAAKPANKRYSSGYGRIEDLATLLIILVVALSAGIAAWVAIEKFRSTPSYSHIVLAVGVALVSVLVNWLVGEYKLKVGREVNSAALQADGTHARIDALAALAAATGIALAGVGLKWADALVGLGIAGIMVYLLAGTTRTLYYRMMEAVDPLVLEKVATAARKVEGVIAVHDIQGRWLGRELQVTLHIDCESSLSVREAHEIGRHVEEVVCGEVSEARLEIHIDPGGSGEEDYHGHHHLDQHGKSSEG